MKFTIKNRVRETNEYDAFSYARDNRKIKENQKLKEEIKANGILVPIIVNEKHEIIDGQHRFEIARRLKLPIPYIVISGAGKKEMISINTTSKQWTIFDFIESYSEEGIEEYEIMKNLIERYSVNISILCGLAFNTVGTREAVQKVRDGRLKFANLKFLISYLDFYQELVENTVLGSSTALAASLYTLYRLEKFEPNRVFDKSGLISEKLKGVTQQGMTTQVVLECYNMRLRSGSASEIRFHKNAKGNFEFFEDLKKELIGCEQEITREV